ncbi:hypothetical protein FXO38_29965 [Capsicum annuum]|nr:hypothetical protein FXO38_29965 [Capsicum annuum]
MRLYQYQSPLEQGKATLPGIAKSIISENGTIDFAKRFWTKDMQLDLSPIPLRALTACRTTVGLCQLSARYSISISMLQRLGGAGFRVRSRLHSTQSKRWERLKAAAQKLHRSYLLSLEYWIGRKGFAFRSLFEAGLDERGQVRDSLSLST